MRPVARGSSSRRRADHPKRTHSRPSPSAGRAPWGFDIFGTQHEYGFFNVYFDKDGNFVKTIVHDNLNFVITANGKTLIERDKLTIIFTADGSREIGHVASSTASWTNVFGQPSA